LCPVCSRVRDGWCRRSRRGRRVMQECGKSEPRLARPAIRPARFRRRAVSMLFRNKRGNTFVAPGVHAEVGYSQQRYARGSGRHGDFSGSSWCIVGSQPCCDAKPIGTFCVPKVSGVSCLAGSVGIASWRKRCGRVPARPHIGRAFPGYGSTAMTSSLALTSRRPRRATAGDVGASNR